MSHAAFIKILVLVLVAFIMCLPEFFTSHQEIEFSCLQLHPYPEDMGRRGNSSQTQQVRDAGGGACRGCANISTEEPACRGLQNMAHPGMEWYCCRTEMGLSSLRRSISLSGAGIKMSLVVHKMWPLPDVVTSAGLLTIRWLLATPEVMQQVSQCCIDCAAQNDTANAAATSNRSCCILRAQWTNSTNLNASLPQANALEVNWFSGQRAVWLALILIVIFLVLGSVVYEVYWKTHCHARKNMLLPGSAYQPLQSPVRDLNEVHVTAYRYRYKRSSLSPIHEEESADSVFVSLPGRQQSPTGRTNL
ncbi:hypothetical protein JZ751_016448 [Albula glossodonta]|uniref:Uncharacterized protein n=1 Tax=Albula glossodonta TaxID=121402 RepID=A0A8T2NSA1_9TELE|nr:hypothetical protein JZ751_016448 [Albula glossodonta]